MNTIARPISRKRMAGLTLVELMVAMTIGLMLLSGISYLFLGARQTFRTTENLSRIQENARYALEVMARDIRMAGYVGCGNMRNVTLNTIANPPIPPLLTTNALTGSDWPGAAVSNFSGSGVTRVAGDSISVMGAFGGGVPLAGNLVPSNANVQLVDNRYGFAVNDVLVVTNCVNADMFRATNVSSSGSITTIAHSNSTNTGNRIGSYGGDAFAFKVEQYTYFIGTKPNGRRSLYKTSLTEGTRELIEDVWDMEITYGVDTPEDSLVYQKDWDAEKVSAEGRWPDVLTVQLRILFVSAEDGITVAPQALTFNEVVTPSDRRMYQVFTSTIGVRNRLP